MYRVLIVDDEIWVRKGITQKLKNCGFNFDWIGEATDSEEALEIIEAKQPHLVITDIRMNEMDGIQLIRNILDRFSDIRFVIISGYGEFEYAEQAINMGVSGYILKPIKDDQFFKTISKVYNELGNKQEITDLKLKKEKLEKKYDEVKLQQLTFQLLNLDAAKVQGELTEEGPFAGFTCFVLAIMNIDSTSYSMSGFKYQDASLIKFAIKNILNELWTKKNVLIMDNPKDNNQILALFYGLKASGLIETSHKQLMDAYSKIRNVLQIDMTFAISSDNDRVGIKLYNEAWEAFGAKMIYGGNRIFRYDNIKNDGKFIIPEQKLKILQNYLEVRDYRNMEIVLRDLFSQRNMEYSTGAYIRFIYFEIINILVKVGIKMGVEVSKKISSAVFSGDLASQYGSVEELIKYILTIAINMLKSETYPYIDRKSLITNVTEYMENNYDSSFSVKDLSRLFAINPEYLSTLYRQETGKTLIRHLTEIRIDAACRLLRESDYNTIDVSKNVGYADPQYFYKVFKRIMGKTPQEYKNGL